MIEARKTSVCTCGTTIKPGDLIGRYGTRYYQCEQCFKATLQEEHVLEEMHETRDS